MAWYKQNKTKSSFQEVPEIRNNNWMNVGDTFKEMHDILTSPSESITAISNLNPGILRPGTMNEYHGDNESYYMKLSSVPVKRHNDYYTIFDIHAHGSNLKDRFISVLAVVKQVGSIRECMTKAGKSMRRCEVKRPQLISG
ncbi:hypothetical protein HELRODRAFT_169052 [Helobdella robusta]|uniref:Uncharacterized protein n=1 Tax=Helobdella robusta TaxID=6412 RepID=T1F1B8_HELRO|nr:hypothetical protein HELRODRAFT_169052 [Helobdella robusta]ESO09112.1 hypothetical protein HELRODRAFT_169052 [Helobdella robusta]